MKTLNKMITAATLAATIGSAMATAVPGVTSGTFEFSQPGITATPDAGLGFDAITNINKILDAVGSNGTGTGGTDIDNDRFWNAMVDPTERNVFEYTAAAPMIEELIFTVTGEIFVGVGVGSVDANGYRKALPINTGTGIDEIGDMEAKDSVSGNAGKYRNADLKGTKTAAIQLLTLLGLTTNMGNVGDEVVITKTSGATPDIQALATDVSSAGIIEHVKSASIDAQGFDNANKLIKLIAEQLKTGFILDVKNAQTVVAAIAAQHNGFLVASIVDEAKKLKDIIKYIGVQEAAVAIGKNAKGNCTNANNNSSTVCVKIGESFQDLIGKLPATSSVVDYNLALAAVDKFADHIIAFNGVVSTSPVDHNAITSQFGTITVDKTSQLYADLKQITGATGSDLNATNPSLDADGVIDLELAAIGDSLDLLGTDFVDLFTITIDRTSVETTTVGTVTTITTIVTETDKTINLH